MQGYPSLPAASVLARAPLALSNPPHLRPHLPSANRRPPLHPSTPLAVNRPARLPCTKPRRALVVCACALVRCFWAIRGACARLRPLRVVPARTAQFRVLRKRSLSSRCLWPCGVSRSIAPLAVLAYRVFNSFILREPPHPGVTCRYKTVALEAGLPTCRAALKMLAPIALLLFRLCWGFSGDVLFRTAPATPQALCAVIRLRPWGWPDHLPHGPQNARANSAAAVLVAPWLWWRRFIARRSCRASSTLRRYKAAASETTTRRAPLGCLSSGRPRCRP